jgi:hypothetical protein
MKFFSFYLSLICLFFFSCQSKTEDVKREKVTFQTITDSIFTRMPGRLIKVDDYLVWEDPFASDKFIHVIDIHQNKKIGIMGKKGQGPEEFNTPSISSSFIKNNIFVYDLNSPHQAYFSIDSLKENKNPYRKYENNKLGKIMHTINFSENGFIISQPAEEKRFKLISNDKSIEFGDPFIDNKIDNSFDIYQGAMGINEKKHKFVFASLRLPYLEIYDIKDHEPSLVYTSELPKNTYNIEGTTLKPNTQKKGARDLTLLKDYIAIIQRDYEIDKTDESTVGMNFDKLPKTVFLYDYEGKLERIVDLGIPLIRIAGDTESNTLYAIGVDPEFVLIKSEL